MSRPGFSPLVVVLVLACGTKASDDVGSSTSASTGSSGHTESGSDSDTITDSATDGASCDAYGDHDTGPVVTITIRNATEAAIHITQAQGCVVVPGFALEHDGTPVSFWDLGCGTSCDAVLEGACACPAACAQDTVVRIDPGGTHAASWLGNILVPSTLPAHCTDPGSGCGDECNAVRQAEAGSYAVIVSATDDMTCDVRPCECLSPGPDGSCSIVGTVTGTTQMASSTFSYADETTVEVVFR